MEANSNGAVKTATAEGQEITRAGRFYKPAVDIIETAEALELFADLPGTTSDKIHVSFENGQLNIHAEVPRRQDDRTAYISREYGVADYHRSFAVDQRVDSAKISANYENGVLKLVLPKAEDAKPRKVVVKQS